MIPVTTFEYTKDEQNSEAGMFVSEQRNTWFYFLI